MEYKDIPIEFRKKFSKSELRQKIWKLAEDSEDTLFAIIYQKGKTWMVTKKGLQFIYRYKISEETEETEEDIEELIMKKWRKKKKKAEKLYNIIPESVEQSISRSLVKSLLKHFEGKNIEHKKSFLRSYSYFFGLMDLLIEKEITSNPLFSEDFLNL